MRWLFYGVVLVLCVGLVSGVKPTAYVDGDVLKIPYSDDGLEYNVRDAIEYYALDSGAFYVWEYDPDYEVSVWKVNDRTVGLRIDPHPNRTVDPTPYVEVCIGDDSEFDIPGLKPKDIHNPVNCQGSQAVSFDGVPTGTNFTFMLKQPIRSLEYFIGEGAGGGLGCTPPPPGGCCGVISVTDNTPTSVNTETNFDHEVSVGMCTSFAGCQCPVVFKHKPTTQYFAYTTAYPGSFSNSVLKTVSGSTTQVIYSGGIVKVVANCGGKHGTAYARIEPGEYGNVDTTITCSDVVNPNVIMSLPANLSNYDQPLINLTCNASDNTALKTIAVYDNRTGAYELRGSQSYSGLTYSASKTFLFNYSGYESVKIGWFCLANDTAYNTDTDERRYFNYTEPPFIDVYAPLTEWVYPTPDNGSVLDQDYIILNLSVNDSGFMSGLFDWDGSMSGYWSFDTNNINSVFDDSGNGNNGTYNNGLNNSMVEVGFRGDGLRFDGSNDYINLSVQLENNIGSYGGWFYFDDLSCSGGYCVPMQQSDIGDAGFEIFTFGNNVYCWDGAADVPSGGAPITSGSWYHILCVHNGSHFGLYLNGSLYGSVRSSVRNVTISDMVVGGQNYASYGYYNGLADEIVVFDRALSAVEVGWLFNLSNGSMYKSFEGLPYGDYTFKAFVIDDVGNLNITTLRIVFLKRLEVVVEDDIVDVLFMVALFGLVVYFFVKLVRRDRIE